MKTISIFLILTLAILTSCSESNQSLSNTDQYQKDSVFNYILEDDNLVNEMTDSLINRYPRIVQRKLDLSNAMASNTDITGEPMNTFIDSITFTADKPKTLAATPIATTPVAKPVTTKTQEPLTTEPIETNQPEPKSEPKSEPILEARKAETYQFSNGQFKVDGTSSLHDWDLTATNFSTTARILLDESHSLKDIETLTITLPVANLTNKDSKLTKNAWDALNADQHKNIIYKISNATIVPQQDGTYLVKTTGNLTISGVTKSIKLDATCQVNSENKITLSGNTVINMTDYNVKPPTFMLGAMKTGDNVKLNYRVVLNRVISDPS